MQYTPRDSRLVGAAEALIFPLWTLKLFFLILTNSEACEILGGTYTYVIRVWSPWWKICDTDLTWPHTSASLTLHKSIAAKTFPCNTSSPSSAASLTSLPVRRELVLLAVEMTRSHGGSVRGTPTRARQPAARRCTWSHQCTSIAISLWDYGDHRWSWHHASELLIHSWCCWMNLLSASTSALLLIATLPLLTKRTSCMCSTHRSAISGSWDRTITGKADVNHTHTHCPGNIKESWLCQVPVHLRQLLNIYVTNMTT